MLLVYQVIRIVHLKWNADQMICVPIRYTMEDLPHLYWNSRSPWFFQIGRYMEGATGRISILLSAVTGHISVAASARRVQKSGHTLTPQIRCELRAENTVW